MNNSFEEQELRLVIFHFKWWLILFGIFCLCILAVVWAIFSKIPVTIETKTIFLNTQGFESVRSGIDGTLTEVPSLGQEVKAGETIVALQNSKNWQGYAQHTGRVIEVFKNRGEWVYAQEILVLVEKKEGIFRFVSFLPFEQAQNVKEGMEVWIQPSAGQTQEFHKATVAFVSPFVVSEDRLMDLLGNDSLVKFFTQDKPVVEIQIASSETPNNRTLTNATIVLASRRVISYLIPIKKS